jgi:bifunctional non-homologous end joining protein LigD
VSDFQALQNAIHTRRARAIVFFAFDLPWCDGYDLTSSPLEARRWLLLSLIGTRQEGRLRFSEHVEGNGPAALERIREHGLEGLVSKRMGSPYSQARTPAWVKVKCFNQQEFVIGGFTAPEGTRDEFGAMLLGYHDESGKLRFAGKVGTGFSAETLKSLGALLRQRVCPRPPFVNPPTGAEARGVTWVRPELVCQVQFRDWTAEGVIRHTSFRGLREDLDPKAVVREPAGAQAQANAVSAQPSSPPVQAHPRKAPKAAAESPAASTRRLTNPDRVVYPDRSAGYSLTKRQVYEYFEAVAPLMLPYVAGRPLAIVRCPTGEGGKSFFQKHPVRGMPPAVRGADIADSEGKIERHLMINDADGLLGLVQMSALEIHPWGSRAPPPPEAPDHPNLMIFDLDPGADVGWQTVVRSALLLRDSLTQVGLRGFARLSGGKGIHVVVPLRPLHTWAECTRFAKAAAEALVRLAPRWFIATSAIERRQGRIYIDYLRNVRGATAVASYCTRARPGAPVALPVEWDELDGLPSASAFNPMSVMRRLAAGNLDPWREFQTSAGALPRSDPA